MLIENSFEVPADIDRVWSYLLDVERVVVCMPGAELTETIDDSNWKGKIKVKLGPVSLSFAGKVTVADRDDDTHRVVLKGSGMEQRGKGRAAATVTTTAERSDGGTRVNVTQDLEVQGQVASMSRGMMKDVSARLTKQFAECLEATLLKEEERRPTTEEVVPAAAAAASEAAVGAPVASAAGDQVVPPPTTAAAPTPPSGTPAKGPEVNALSLLAGAFVDALRRLIARLFRRNTSTRS